MEYHKFSLVIKLSVTWLGCHTMTNQSLPVTCFILFPEQVTQPQNNTAVYKLHILHICMNVAAGTYTLHMPFFM